MFIPVSLVIFIFLVFHDFIFQVNKPYLPLASGEYSVATGVIIVASFAIMVCNLKLCNTLYIHMNSPSLNMIIRNISILFRDIKKGNHF